jgi:hypothetical protein
VEGEAYTALPTSVWNRWQRWVTSEVLGRHREQAKAERERRVGEFVESVKARDEEAYAALKRRDVWLVEREEREVMMRHPPPMQPKPKSSVVHL